MLIRSVTLENFKSYQQATVRFHDGTNAIVGRNGAGKSSLVEAIGYALFDHTSATRQSDLLREGASTGRVVVRFVSSYDEREYEVERALGKTGTTRHRIYDHENGYQVLAEGVAEVRQWLREHLGIARDANMDDLFRNTIGVPQGSFTAPFLLAAGERKRIFDPLLQVDEYDRAFQNLREATRLLGDQQIEIQQEIAKLEGQLERLPACLAELAAAEAAIVVLEIQARALDADLRAARAALRELDQAEQSARQAQQAHADMGYQTQAAEGDLRQAQKDLDEAEQARGQVALAEPGYRAYRAAEERMRALEAERTVRDQAQRALEQALRERERVVAQRDQVAQTLEQLERAAARLETLRPQAEEQERLQVELDKARAQAGLLPEVQRQAQATTKEISDIRARLERIAEGLRRVVELEHELAQIESGQDTLAEQETRMQGERNAAQGELTRLTEQSEALAKEQGARCPTCEADLTPAHRQDLLARNRQREAALGNQLKALDRSIRAATQSRQQGQQRLNALRGELRDLPTESARTERQAELDARNLRLSEQQARIAELSAWSERAQELAKALETLGDPLSEARILAAQVAERERRQGELARLDAALAELEGKLALQRAEIEQYADLEQALQAARGELDVHRAQHDTYLTRVETARQYDARQARLTQAVQRLATLTVRFKELTQELERALQAYDAGRHAAARDQVERLSSETTRARTQLANQRERCDSLRQEIQRLSSLKETLLARQTEREEIQALVRLLEEMRELLRSAGPFITQQFVARISHQASSFYCDIMNDYSGRLIWKEDYDLELEVNGRKRGFQQLSGGEQMSAALALRLALLRHLSSIDVAFFDEPTAHLDPERRDGLADKIMQVKGFSQLFVISHDDTFERAAQSYLRVVKEDGVSRVEAS